MKRVLDRELSRIADEQTMETGLPSLELMERAGRQCFLSLFPELKKDDRILILCGSGGNGGDGYVLGRYLSDAGMDVSCLAVLPPRSEGSVVNRRRYQGRMVSEVEEDYSFVVDAVFGTGMARTVEGRPRSLLAQAASCRGRKVSIDVPSGMDATTGASLGFLFPADLVLTIQFHKLGFFLADLDLSRIRLLDIGILPPPEGGAFLLEEGDPIPDGFFHPRPLTAGEFSRLERATRAQNLLSMARELSDIAKDLTFETSRYRILLSEGRAWIKRRDVK